MRTTLNLPEDVYEAINSLARYQKISLGDAAADLVRRGLAPKAPVASRNGFPVFDVPADAKPITLEMTLAAEDDEL